jgi:uncharacterized membrane protein (DUF106 family)
VRLSIDQNKLKNGQKLREAVQKKIREAIKKNGRHPKKGRHQKREGIKTNINEHLAADFVGS